MAIPNQQIGWSQRAKLLWNIAKQLEKLTQVAGNIQIAPATTTTTTTIASTTTSTSTTSTTTTVVPTTTTTTTVSLDTFLTTQSGDNLSTISGDLIITL